MRKFLRLYSAINRFKAEPAIVHEFITQNTASQCDEMNTNNV